MISYQKTHEYSILDIDSPVVSRLISYPKVDPYESRARLKEIKSIGITKILFYGLTQIDNFRILGKGHNGIVLCVMDKFKKKYALKIRRIDSSRKDSNKEVNLQKRANSIGIGPKIISYTKNFILMDLISGLPIIRFVDVNDLNKNMLSSIVRQIFLQCYQLDKIHLDHGELNKINNHVFVSLNKFNDVHIIDFESSSMDRRPSNVTSVTQALFLYGSLAKTIKQHLSISSHDMIINSLQIYKKNQSKENFLDLLSIIIKDKS
ncbi:MAG: RIO1 family regulatory kinase/ATPase [Nitrososphaeraceae archaeon]